MMNRIAFALAWMLVAIQSTAMAADVNDDAIVQAALLACQFAGNGLEIVAEEMGKDPTVVDTAEARRAYISTIDKFVGKWVVMTPELQAILLTSFVKGLQRQKEDPLPRVQGLTKVEQAKYLAMSWGSAGAVTERQCVFRMGELHGQGQLRSVITLPPQ